MKTNFPSIVAESPAAMPTGEWTWIGSASDAAPGVSLPAAPPPAPSPQAAIQNPKSKIQNPLALALGSRLITVARFGWLALAVVTAGLFIASVPARYDQLANPTPAVRLALAGLDWSVNLYAAYQVGLEIGLALVFSSVALVIFWRRSHEGVALVVATMLLLAGTAMRPLVVTMNALLVSNPEWTPLVRVLNYLTWLSIVGFFYLFPDGRYFPRWTKAMFVGVALIFVPWDLFPESPLNPERWATGPFVLTELILWGSCLVAQITRYRQVSDPAQRQQTRWVVFGGTITVGVGLACYLTRALNPALTQAGTRQALLYDVGTLTVLYLAILITPLTIGISIFRYRLWGIDVLINRTLVYVPLTAILAGLYAASTTLFQKLFIALTGNTSDAAIVITTLVLATTFTPVKNALQAFVDRRFKEAPDSAKVLQAFRAAVQNEVGLIDPHRIGHRLLDEAVRAFGAQGGALVLGPAGRETLLVTAGTWTGKGVLDLPVAARGTHLGRLLLGPRAHDLTYSPHEEADLVATVQVVAEALTAGAEAGEGLENK